MSKINKFRLLNISYENQIVVDQLFDCKDKHSIFLLENGGGKSVFVQILSSLFVSMGKKDIRSKKRSFSSYFTSKVPSVIMVEWSLDNSKNKYLVGALIQRDNNENNRSGIKEYNFTAEYPEGSQDIFTIENLPLIDIDKEGNKSIKSFEEIKTFIKELSSTNASSFKVFNMLSSSKSKAYFRDLAEHNISKVEWESIIKDINETEGGLVKLYNQYDSSVKLLEHCILPVIEEHRVGEEEKTIDVISSSFRKYIEEYDKNKDFEENKKVADRFLEDILKLKTMAEEVLLKSENLEGLREKIYEYIRYANFKKETCKNEIEEIFITIQESKERLDQLRHEEVSYRYLKNKEELDLASLNIKDAEYKIESLDRSKKEKEDKIDLHTTLKYIELEEEKSQRLRNKEKEVEIIMSKNKEEEADLNKYGTILKIFYTNKVNEIKLQKRNFEQDLEEAIGYINDLKTEEEVSEIEGANLNKKISRLETMLEQYDKEEAEFINKYQEDLTRLITRQYREGLLEEINQGLNLKLEELTTSIAKLEEDEASLQKERDEVRDSLGMFKNRRDNLLEKEKEDKKVLEKYLVELERRKDIWNKISDENLEEEVIYSKEGLLERLDHLKSIKSQQQYDLAQRKQETQLRIDLLNKGDLTNVPQEIRDNIDAMDCRYGLDYMRKHLSGQDEEYKKSFIQKNPLLAYSVLGKQGDLEDIKKLKSKESFILPIVDINKLNNTVDIPENIYINFNEELLDNTLIDRLQQEISQIEGRIEGCKEDIDIYNTYIQEVNKQTASLKARIELEESLDNIQKELEDLRKKRNTKEKRLEKIKTDLIDIKTSLKDKSAELNYLNNKKTAFDKLKIDYLKYIVNLEDLYVNFEKRNNIKERLKELKLDIKGQVEIIDNLKEDIRGIKNKIEKEKENLLKYEEFSDKINLLQQMERVCIADCIASFDACQKNLSEDNLEGLKKDIADLKKDINEYKKHIKLERFTKEELNSTIYSEDTVKALKEDIKQVEHNIKIENIRLQGFIKQEASAKTRIEQNREVLRILLKENFLDKTLIQEVNFQEEIQNEEAEIRELKMEEAVLKQDKTTLEKIDEAFINIISEKDLKEDLNYSQIYNWAQLSIRDFVDLRMSLKSEEAKLERELDKAQKDIQEKANSVKTEYTEKDYILSFERVFYNARDPKRLLNEMDNDISITQVRIELWKNNLKGNEDMLNQLSDNSLNYAALILKEVESFANKTKLNGRNIIKVSCPRNHNKKEAGLEMYKDFYKKEAQKYSILSKEERLMYKETNIVNTYKLLEVLVPIHKFVLKVEKDKPEIGEDTFCDWTKVVSFSGAEEVLGRFSIFVAIANYINTLDKGGSKALILDNPFANIQSDVKIEKLYQLADKANIQLICFTAMEIEKVISINPMIYKLGFRKISPVKKEVYMASVEEKEETMI